MMGFWGWEGWLFNAYFIIEFWQKFKMEYMFKFIALCFVISMAKSASIMCGNGVNSGLKSRSYMNMWVVFPSLSGKIAKSVLIDDFIRFNLDKLYLRGDLLQNDTLYLQVGNSGASTGDAAIVSPAAYFRVNNKMVQQLSIVAQFSNGKIIDFTWNHGWVDCSAGECLTDPSGNQNCYYTSWSTWDPNIFLTWNGDDGNGFYMMSNAFSFKEFNNYMINSYYTNALQP